MYLWDTLQGVLQVYWIVLRINITPPHVKIYVMEPNVFMGYLERGIACSLSLFEHEQYLYK